MEFYVMTRKGNFQPHKYTKNQCKVEGHRKYFYEIKMCFSHKVRLNEQKFIIDHKVIDDLIQSLKLIGSCEEMHSSICTAIKNLFSTNNITLLGCKTNIIPSGRSLAHMSYIYINPRSNSKVAVLLS